MLMLIQSERAREKESDGWDDLFEGEEGSEKHEISTNRLSVDHRQA